MEKITYFWKSAEAFGFFPWITIVAMGVYFMVRFIFSLDKPKSIPYVAVGCFLGQLYFDMPMPTTWAHDLIGTLFFTLMHVVASVGIYSFAEYVKVLDILDTYVKKKIEAKFTGNQTPPAV